MSKKNGKPKINSRRSGYTGESDAKKYLIAHGWTEVERRPSGEKGSDLRATDPSGKRWSIEVKYTDAHHSKHWKQCCYNAAEDGLPPMLMWRPKNVHTSDWLVLRNDGNGNHWQVLS